MRVRGAAFLFVAPALSLGVVVEPAKAVGAAPGWELYANTYPTHLVQGVNEVQEVEVRNATGGTFTLSLEERGVEQTTSPIAYPATAVEVESALEELPAIGGAGAGGHCNGRDPNH